MKLLKIIGVIAALFILLFAGLELYQFIYSKIPDYIKDENIPKGYVQTDGFSHDGWDWEEYYGFKDSNLFVSRLPFSANLLVFSLLGVSQAASKASKLPRKILTERCFAVLVCLFFTKARQKDEGMLTHCEGF